MTYGRLDVYWPDGPMASYQLSKPNVAIGRSPGNDIVLDATAISRYHASLFLSESDVYLQDLESVNGTYVDGRKLTPNEPYPLHGGEEILVGEVRMIFRPADDNPTEPLTDVEVTRRIEYEQPTYRVELVGLDRPVTPGVYLQTVLAIHNLSDEDDRYFIEIDGVPKEWVRLERVEQVLGPGETAHLMLSFKPLRRPDTLPGDYPFTVRVRSKSRPTQTVDASMTLRVLPYSGFGIDLGRQHVQSGEALPIYVHNQGNAPLQLSFSARDSSGNLQVTFLPPHVTLGAGQRLTVRAHIRPQQIMLFGAPRRYNLDIVARAHNPSGFIAALPASFTAQPLLTGWRLWALAGGILAVLLVIAGLLALLLGPPPAPEILSIALSTENVVQGEPITLQWAVRNAGALYVEVDGSRQDAVLTPQDTRLTFNIPTPGDHEIALVAVNGDQSVRSALPVHVYETLTITEFSADPGTLVRYVTQDVLLTWQVSGGTRVWLRGLEALTGEPDDVEYAPSDSRLVTASASAPVTITLVAEGGGGQMAEQTLTLAVEDPVCTVIADETAVRAGPSDLHRILTTINAGQVVVPDSRDGSGTWLRVFANDGQRVWIASAALDCLNIDPLALAVDNAPPTPMPTDTPTPTMTPSSTPSLTPTALPTATPPPTWTRTPRPESDTSAATKTP